MSFVSSPLSVARNLNKEFEEVSTTKSSLEETSSLAHNLATNQFSPSYQDSSFDSTEKAFFGSPQSFNGSGSASSSHSYFSKDQNFLYRSSSLGDTPDSSNEAEHPTTFRSPSPLSHSSDEKRPNPQKRRFQCIFARCVIC